MSGSSGSIFLDFRLPSATTWFYLSLVLAVALFVRFRHWTNWQNWDVLLMFLLVPGLLYLRECQARRQEVAQLFAQTLSTSVTEAAAGHALGSGLAETALPWSQAIEAAGRLHQADRGVRRAYLLLLLGSAALLLRCLADLFIQRRQSFQANLSTDGLVWLTVMLLIVFSITTALPAFEAPKTPEAGAVLIERAGQVLARQPVVERLFDLDRLLAGMNVVAHVFNVAGLFWIGWRYFGRAALGASAALLYLLLPYSAYQARDLLHVAPASLLIGMIVVYRLPSVAGFLLGLGCVLVNFPLFLAPLWISYYLGRGLGRFLIGLGAAVAVLAGALWWGGTLWQEWQSVLNWPDWRVWDVSRRPSGEGLWSGLELHYAYRVPLFIAYLALAAGTAIWPREKNLGHLVTLTSALTLGVQFWYGRAGGTYVLWYAPLLILVMLRPNFRDLEERAIPSWRERLRDWWQRLAGGSTAPAPPAATGTSKV
ncbi:MAG: hypothetical protein RMJ19_11840 [Gemmatales bacterium]|nr:hypothetical protein [Gemmatales bacterium]MCS7161153.1 hypothetical protein [Gemmatales bacterium]MDW8176356.1 hypothetical protein [Gemmatales bacterium]MDW8221700.1 hypothetical protein [Gemmatales bacterium]